MKSCKSCIHFKACEDWAKSFLDPKKAEFPFRTEDETKVALCEFYESVADYHSNVIYAFLSAWRMKLVAEGGSKFNSRIRSFLNPNKSAEAAAELAMEVVKELEVESEEKCEEKSEDSKESEE